MAGRPGKPLIDPTHTRGLIAFSRASFATHSISLLRYFLPAFLLCSPHVVGLACVQSPFSNDKEEEEEWGGAGWREGALSRIAGHVKAIPYASLHHRGRADAKQPRMDGITDRGRQFRAALKRPPRRSSTRAKDDLGSTEEGEQREAAEEEFGLNIQGRVQKESLPLAKESGKKGTRKARRRLPCTYARMRSARLTASARLRQRPTSISIIIDCQFGAQTWKRRREGGSVEAAPPPLLRSGQIET